MRSLTDIRRSKLTLTAVYSLQTPAFVGRLDNQSDPLIGGGTIKAALRFWWRALKWGRLVKAYPEHDDRSPATLEATRLHELAMAEAKLFGHRALTDQEKDALIKRFGMTKDVVKTLGQGRFRVLVRPIGSKFQVLHPQEISAHARRYAHNEVMGYLGYGPFSGGKATRACLAPGQSFQVVLNFIDPPTAEVVAELKLALRLLGTFGGVGSRCRRGFGALALTVLDNTIDNDQPWTAPTTKGAYAAQVDAVFMAAAKGADLNLPPYTAMTELGSAVVVEASDQLLQALELAQPPTDWCEAMICIGRALKTYRKEGLGGAELTIPEHVIFGLPTRAVRTFNSSERRASPLLLHPHRLDDGWVCALLVLPAIFFPGPAGEHYAQRRSLRRVTGICRCHAQRQVWRHHRACTGLSGCCTDMTAWLLQVSIGPVDGFIDQSRRLRDLWSGSFLLSWLSGQAMAAALEQPPTIRLLAPSISKSDLDAGTAAIDPLLRAIWQARTSKQLVDPAPLFGSLVNRFDGVLETDHIDEAVMVGKHCQQAVQQAWARLSSVVFETFVSPAFAKADLGNNDIERIKGLWADQIDAHGHGFTSVMWALEDVPEWQPIEAVAAACTALDRRKLWRSDGPPVDAPDHPIERCRVLAGWPELSGAIQGPGGRTIRDRFWRAVADGVSSVLYRHARSEKVGSAWPVLEFAEDERLSAPALVKRLFPALPGTALQQVFGWIPGAVPNEDEKTSRQRLRVWPSTAYVASVAWAESVTADERGWLLAKRYAHALHPLIHLAYRVAEDPTSQKITALRQRMLGGASLFHGLDGTLYYDAGVKRAKTSLGRHAADPEEHRLARRRAHQDFLADLKGQGISDREPSNFYAILRMDGDRMGEILGKAPEAATALSNGLLGFLGEARGLVDQHLGMTVFSGGDDLLAVLPLETALSAAQTINQAFHRKLGKALENDPAAWIAPHLSISAGIAIADYQMPLGLALRESKRLLEDVAKRQNGRNSIAIAAYSAPDPTFEWVSNWQTSLKSQPLQSILDVVGKLQREGVLSNSWFYRVIRQLHPIMDRPVGDESDKDLSLIGADYIDILVAEALDTVGERHVALLREVATDIAVASYLETHGFRPIKKADDAPPQCAPASPSGLKGALINIVRTMGLMAHDHGGTTNVADEAPAMEAAAIDHDKQRVLTLLSLQLIHFLLRHMHPQAARRVQP